jgi:hypothetical protein
MSKEYPRISGCCLNNLQRQLSNNMLEPSAHKQDKLWTFWTRVIRPMHEMRKEGWLRNLGNAYNKGANGSQKYVKTCS